MANENKTIKISPKDENEWIEKLKVQPTVRINLDDLDNDKNKKDN
jgi:hypothetical protein